MKIDDLQLNEAGAVDWIKSKLAPKVPKAEPERREPTMDAPAATPDFSARLGNFPPMAPSKVTGPNTNAGPNKTAPTSQIPNTKPTVAPTNTVVYPPKTTDTTQAILPPSIANKTDIAPQTGTLPNTNVQMPSNMGTAPGKQDKPGNVAPPPETTGTIGDLIKQAGDAKSATPGNIAPAPDTTGKPATTTVEPAATTAEPTAPAGSEEPAAAGQQPVVPKKGGIWQGIKGAFKGYGDAKAGREAGQAADAARQDNINNQVKQFMLAAQGIDPSDVDSYKKTLQGWAEKNMPSAGKAAITATVNGLKSADPGSITQAVGEIVNTSMRNRAMGISPDAKPANTTPKDTTATDTTPADNKAADTTPEPTTPAEWPAGVPKFNQLTGQKFASAEEAQKTINSPEYKQGLADLQNEPEQTPPGNSFGQMAGQLKTMAPPEKTSTGGTLTQTPTGQVHTANTNAQQTTVPTDATRTTAPNFKQGAGDKTATYNVPTVDYSQMLQPRGPSEQPAAQPQAQELDLDQLAAQRAAKQAQGQADQQQALAQMKAKADADAAANKPSVPADPTAPRRSVTGDVPVPDDFGKQKPAQPQWTGRQPQKQTVQPMAAESRVDFGAMLFNRMKSGK